MRGLRVLGVALAAVVGISLAAAPPAAAQDGSYYSFTSMPDFLNADFGDNTVSPYWEPGDPPSTNEMIETAIAEVIRDVAAQPGDDLLVAGDQIYGHWFADQWGYQLFGPVDTNQQKDAAMTVAANLFYSQWWQRFAGTGLNIHGAVGDHEIGDNPWGRPQDAYKRSRKELFESLWAQYFTAGGTRYPMAYDETNYAVALHPEVLLVTLNVFRDRPGGMRVEVEQGVLKWVDRTLRQARRQGVDWLVVQGHTPILGPVRVTDSSQLRYRGGSSSDLWRVLRRNEIDLYLCGEVHAISMKARDGITQICHGGLVANGGVNYLTASFGPRQVTLTTREWSTSTDRSDTVWQTDRMRPYGVYLQPGSFVSGELQQRRSGRITQQTGALRQYDSVREW